MSFWRRALYTFLLPNTGFSMRHYNIVSAESVVKLGLSEVATHTHTQRERE